MSSTALIHLQVHFNACALSSYDLLVTERWNVRTSRLLAPFSMVARLLIVCSRPAFWCGPSLLCMDGDSMARMTDCEAPRSRTLQGR